MCRNVEKFMHFYFNKTLHTKMMKSQFRISAFSVAGLRKYIRRQILNDFFFVCECACEWSIKKFFLSLFIIITFYFYARPVRMRCDIEFQYDGGGGVILFAEMAIFKKDFESFFCASGSFSRESKSFPSSSQHHWKEAFFLERQTCPYRIQGKCCNFSFHYFYYKVLS